MRTLFSISFVSLLLALAISSRPALAQDPAPDLQIEPVVDESWGISMRIPRGATVLRDLEEKALLRVVDAADGYSIALTVEQLDLPLEDAVVRAKTLTYATGESVLVGGSYVRQFVERDLKVDGKPGALLYFDYPKRNGKDRLLLGTALVDVGDGLYVVFELEAPLDRYESAHVIFESVLETVSLRKLWELADQRAREAKRSRDWLQTLTPERVRAALVPEQWFRLVETPEPGRSGPERDAGWLRLTQEPYAYVGAPGIRVEVQWRIFLKDGKTVEDALAAYFVGDDRAFEQWMVTTTRRPVNDSPRNVATQPPLTTKEMGTRTGNQIDVKIERPGSGPMSLSFSVPDSYLPQAYAWLLHALLPADAPATYGFYWFNPARRELSYRSDRLAPALDRFTLQTRGAPGSPPLDATYDPSRNTLERRLSPTIKLVPSTKDELQTLRPNG